MVLKDKLKELLKQQDTTAAQVSRKSGVPKNTISDWLAGNSPRDIRQVKRVADALGVTVDFLCFGGSAKPQADQTKTLTQLLGQDWIEGLFEIKLRQVRK